MMTPNFLMMWLDMPSHSGTETLAIILRWVHFLAAITWVGLLYFFNLVNVPFMKQVDAAMKPKILQYMTLPALNLFRWSSVVTVFVGFWYWGQMYLGPDAQREGGSQGAAFGLFFLVWMVAWGISYAAILKAPNPWIVALVVAATTSAAGWAFVNFTPVGADDNHVLCIGVGGGLGFYMMLNVWGIIWRINKKIIRGTLAGTPPADAAVLARQAFLASRSNAFLSVPLLFFMGAASHYPIFGK